MGRLPEPVEDIIGLTSGRLTVTAVSESLDGVRWAECQCSCGNTCVVRLGNVKGKVSKSCGCLRSEHLKGRHGMLSPGWRHGMSQTKTYHFWNALKQRNLLAQEWMTFAAFYKDVGEKPDGKALLRKDTYMPHGPDNTLGWEDSQVTGRQKSSKETKYTIEIDGIRHPVGRWANLIGVERQTLYRWMEYKKRSPAQIEKYIVTRIMSAQGSRGY